MPDVASAVEVFVIIQLGTNCLQLKHWQPVSVKMWRTTEERSKKICSAAERHLTKQIKTSASGFKNCSQAPFKLNQVPTKGGLVKNASH